VETGVSETIQKSLTTTHRFVIFKNFKNSRIFRKVNQISNFIFFQRKKKKLCEVKINSEKLLV